MNKKYLILGGAIFLILCFFGYNSYQSIETQNTKFENPKDTHGNFNESDINSKDLNELVTDNSMFGKSSDFQNQKIFSYSSDFYDIEKGAQMITKTELTYHTFDMNKKTVTQNSILNGKRVNITYPFKNMYEEKGLLSTTYVLVVNTNGLKEIWWSPQVPNLGYDYDDGTRIACYDLKIIKE